MVAGSRRELLRLPFSLTQAASAEATFALELKPGPHRTKKILKKSPPAMRVNGVVLVPVETKGNYKLEKIRRLQVGRSREETAFFWKTWS